MATLGSPEWLAQSREPAAAGLADQADDGGGRVAAPLRVQYVVTGTPSGDVRYATVVDEDGSVSEPVGEIDDPDVTLTTKYRDALAVVRGEVSPNVSYMRGRTKVAGHTGQLVRLLAASSGHAYDTARAELAARTDP